MRVQKQSGRGQRLVPAGHFARLALRFLDWPDPLRPNSGQNSTDRFSCCKHVPMKTGEPLEGRLLYPVYVDNRIAIPAGATLRGTVLQLDPDRSRRIHARLRGDFTPFHIPVVRFDELVLPDGEREPMVSDSAKDGAPDPALVPRPWSRKRARLFPGRLRRKNSGSRMPRHKLRRPAEGTAWFNLSIPSCPITRNGLRRGPPGRLTWRSR